MTMKLPPPAPIDAQVAAEAGVARRRPQARRDQAVRRRDRGEPGVEGALAGRVGPGDGGRQRWEDSRAASDRRSRCERASLVDNRFYKSHCRDRLVPRPSGYASCVHPQSLGRAPGGWSRPRRPPSPRRAGCAAPARRARPASSCAAPTVAAAAAARRRRQAAADHPAGARDPRPARPRGRGRGQRRVPPRRHRDPRRPAELRPGRRPGARARQRAHQPRRQRLQRPRAAAAGRSASRASSAARPTASRAPAPAARPTHRLHRRPARGRDRRDLHELQPPTARRRRPGSCRPTRIELDIETNEGIADGAVLRFYGVPILAAPVLSFPLSDERKSGWLPPTFGLDSRAASRSRALLLEHRAEPRRHLHAASRARKRGVGARRRVPLPRAGYAGEVDAATCCRTTALDRPLALCAALSSTRALLPRRPSTSRLRVLRVSDDDYWKDFPRDDRRSLTPRLLQSDLQLSAGRSATGRPTRGCSAGRCCRRRPDDPDRRRPTSARRRSARATPRRWRGGFEVALRDRVQPLRQPGRPAISRRARPATALHALGSISRPFVAPGWTLDAQGLVQRRLATRSTSRWPDGRRSASRVIPTFSLDSAWVFERDTSLFGRALRQTLEPRLLYVNTPFRDQATCRTSTPAAKDFNFDSIFTENAFSGIDRVSDAHQLTAGVTTRCSTRRPAPRRCAWASCSATCCSDQLRHARRRSR